MGMLSREEIVQNIKDCGQALIDNATNIANNYKYRSNIVITCYVNEHDRSPYISVDTDFIPENTIERYRGAK